MQEEQELLRERYALCAERIVQMQQELDVPKPFDDYFFRMASFLIQTHEVARLAAVKELDSYSLEQWQQLNHSLYEDILPEHYQESYGNPDYAIAKLGESYGRILSFLYTELRGMIVYAFEGRLFDMTILNELLIEIYNCFEEETLPTYRQLQQIIYWFVSDYSDCTVTRRIREAVDPDLDFAVRIVMESDLTDLRYLYRYGEYVTENELETARHLNSLPQEEIDRMASTYTEGYRIGFVLGHKDLSKKKTVNIRYTLGFERMIRAAVKNFEQMGLCPVIYRAAVNLSLIHI